MDLSRRADTCADRFEARSNSAGHPSNAVSIAVQRPIRVTDRCSTAVHRFQGDAVGTTNAAPHPHLQLIRSRHSPAVQTLSDGDGMPRYHCMVRPWKGLQPSPAVHGERLARSTKTNQLIFNQ